MCGRYGIVDTSKLAERFDVEDFEGEIKANYNIAPTQELPVVVRHSPNHFKILKWGIQPAWANRSIINATSEKVPTSRLFKSAFLENRCVVPASYFIEWKAMKDYKQPYAIKRKDDEAMGFAGLILHDKDDKGETIECYVIITTAANAFMKKIHTRMPVLLGKEGEDEWLNPDTDPDRLMKLIEPYEWKDMTTIAISSLVNNARNNFPEILKPIA